MPVPRMRTRQAGTATGPVLLVSQVALVVAIALAVIGKGAFYRTGQLLSGGVLALATALAVAPLLVPVRPPRTSVAPASRPVVAVPMALFGLGLWAAVRGTLAGDPRSGLPLLALTTALSIAFVMGHVASPAQRRVLRRAMVGVGVGAALSGWIGFVWRIHALALPSGRVWRAAGTLTYENALACLVAITALVVMADLVERATPPAAVALYLLLLGGAATQSRAGALALAGGTATLTVAVGWRAVLRSTWRPAVGSGLAAACLVPAIPMAATQRPGLAVAGLCAGLVVAAWPVAHLPAPRISGRARVVAAALTAAIALTAAGVAARPVADSVSALSGRLSMSSPHRVSEHRAALDLLAAQPVTGTGPGRATLRWRDDEGQALRARFVHNEYLQVAVELGLIGGALLVAVLAAIALAVATGRATGGTPWAGVVAALVATAAHGAFDFIWHLPAIPTIAVLLAGTATAPRRSMAFATSDVRASSKTPTTDAARRGAPA